MNIFNKLFKKDSDGEVAVNKSAPDFSLPDETGNTIFLSGFRNQRDVLLFFIRGDFCPICQMMLRTFQKEREKFVAKNIVMLSVSPGPVEINREMVKKFGLDYRLLCDSTQAVMQKYGCHDATDTRAYKEGMPVPGTFLIDKKGIVRYCIRAGKTENGFDYSGIFSVIDNLS